MARKDYTPEQAIGMLREAAGYTVQLPKRRPRRLADQERSLLCFVSSSISAQCCRRCPLSDPHALEVYQQEADDHEQEATGKSFTGTAGWSATGSG
jgi:hypothetical protein